MEKVCRDFMKNKCNRKGCRFIHDKDLCRSWYRDKSCNRENCKFNHFVNPALLKLQKDGKQGKNKHKARNTTDFKPNHNKADLRIIMAPRGMKDSYTKRVFPKDVILADHLYCDFDDMSIYEKLLEEIKLFEEGDKENKIDVFKLWHGDSHLIADDKIGWKGKAPTFDMVINKIRDYFNMDIKATRFNWYRNAEEWKPFHHDAAAVDPKKAAKQNFTVGVSFGATRDIAFQEVSTGKVVTIPMINGQTYTFSRDINIEWKHGIPQIHPDNTVSNPEGRISIIAWGAVPHEEFSY
tara:strand:+ start:541 stop:1422 length:882 start_codon:yes stop_codon:yes gene_type:complete